jgi:hypothetical protein
MRLPLEVCGWLALRSGRPPAAGRQLRAPKDDRVQFGAIAKKNSGPDKFGAAERAKGKVG